MSERVIIGTDMKHKEFTLVGQGRLSTKLADSRLFLNAFRLTQCSWLHPRMPGCLRPDALQTRPLICASEIAMARSALQGAISGGRSAVDKLRSTRGDRGRASIAAAKRFLAWPGARRHSIWTKLRGTAPPVSEYERICRAVKCRVSPFAYGWGWSCNQDYVDELERIQQWFARPVLEEQRTRRAPNRPLDEEVLDRHGCCSDRVNELLSKCKRPRYLETCLNAQVIADISSAAGFDLAHGTTDVEGVNEQLNHYFRGHKVYTASKDWWELMSTMVFLDVLWQRVRVNKFPKFARGNSRVASTLWRTLIYRDLLSVSDCDMQKMTIAWEGFLQTT